ncbi:MAG: flagellar basal body P-ring protein FlgI [Planctomycetes bacterium]|nr:flagellar basal body P-ring protein FlgI [Planctomycetota bacterium]
MTRKVGIYASAVMLSAAFVAGCEPWDGQPFGRNKPPEPTIKMLPYKVDTIAQYAANISKVPAAVGGYGVVVGLGRNGSSEVPAHVERYLVEYLTKQARLGSITHGTEDIKPREFLRDIDTAVVFIGGSIPPCSPGGTRFDVFIKVLPQTSTKSLMGGVLMPAELYQVLGDSATPGGPGEIRAVGGGEILLNPFLDPTNPKDHAGLIQGRIPNGGLVSKDQPIRLQLFQPDYAKANIIMNRINERFGSVTSGLKVANASNNYSIDITIPPAYKSDYKHLLDLIDHLSLASGPGALENHARRIAKAMELPDANYEELALVWEAMGPQVLAIIRPLYKSSNPMTAFFAAATGMKLEDYEMAGQVVMKFAESAGSPAQFMAIEELGRHQGAIGAKSALRKLLDDDNEMVRVAAYEALASRGDQTITQLDVGGSIIGEKRMKGTFKLDLVNSSKGYVIYASQTGQPRFAIFGRDMPVARNVFFSLADGSVRVNGTGEGRNETLKLWRIVPRTGKPSDQLECEYLVRSLILKLGMPAQFGDDSTIMGLNLTYGETVSVMAGLCKQGDIKAKFVLQQSPELQKMYRNVGTSDRPD